MPSNTILKWLWRLFLTALGLAVGWLFFRYALPWLLPFLIGLLLSKWMEPLVCLLRKKARLPRWAASALVTVAAAGTLLWLLFWGLSRLIFEARNWLEQLPAMMANVPDLASDLRGRLETLIAAAPPEMQEFLRSSLENLLQGGVRLPDAVTATLGTWVGAAAAALPGVMLFTVAAVLSTYFISSDYPRVTAALLRQIPGKRREQALRVCQNLLNTVGKWLRAEGVLALISFGLAAVGFAVLRVEHGLLIAVGVAAVDALPVVGSGLALMPWAVYSLLSGDGMRAVGLSVLWGVVTLTRGFLEPKLVGQHIGLHPLAALMSMYIGFQVLGVGGMLLLPILVILLKQLHEWGYLRIWKDEDAGQSL
jgi:sporulation integral membrane protein YtvI